MTTPTCITNACLWDVKQAMIQHMLNGVKTFHQIPPGNHCQCVQMGQHTSSMENLTFGIVHQRRTKLIVMSCYHLAWMLHILFQFKMLSMTVFIYLVCYHIIRAVIFKIHTLECLPKDPTQFQESCEFTGVPPTAPPPTIDCGSNEIAVTCDSCAEAFCCDSGKVSTNIHLSKHDVACSVT